MLRAQCNFIIANRNERPHRCGNVVIINSVIQPPLVLCHHHEKFSGQQVPAQHVMTRWRWEIKQLHSAKVRDPQTLVSGIAPAQTEGRKYIASELAHRGVPDRMAAQVAHQTEKTWTDFPELGICTLLREIY